MDWKWWSRTLIKNPKFIIRVILIKIGIIKNRCQEGGRIMTIQQAQEMKKIFNGIPENMLELAAECGCYFKTEQKRTRFLLSIFSNQRWRILSTMWINAK